MRINIEGVVQGVGFRPFIYQTARQMNLNGWVRNCSEGILIEIEGTEEQLDQFIDRLNKEKPQNSSIQRLRSEKMDPVGYASFEILPSFKIPSMTVPISPDYATCAQCLREIFEPTNRRYLYPFTNCTHCGPRFSIIEALPYDRIHTSMKRFKMCNQCLEEYSDPYDRRFHAQPNACQECGPNLELWDHAGHILDVREEALFRAAEKIRSGYIVALKGVGGFHLIVDARNDNAVLQLRQRKHRGDKAFALMYPSLERVKLDCQVGKEEEDLLVSPESPIVLLFRHDSADRISTLKNSPPVSAWVAPGNPYFGIMLPYTPLHHILMRDLAFPVVATSGNLSEEPICTDENEALNRLHGVADYFLVHNRPIVHPVDDSVVRVMMRREMVLRRSRGYAPFPISLHNSKFSFLAVGGHLKNTIAIASGQNVLISPHLGDLEGVSSFRLFQRMIDRFQKFYEIRSPQIACDMHPSYLSTQYAKESGFPCLTVQHHHAHVLSCMAENGITGTVLGVAWDGSGHGTDGTLWGGEFLEVNETGFKRLGHFRLFPLPGGEKAFQEPRRTAIGILFEILGEKTFDFNRIDSFDTFSKSDLDVIRQMLHRRFNTPVTSSVGRLFDGIASLTGLRQLNTFEGQAAMELEFSIANTLTEEYYALEIVEREIEKERRIIANWEPMVHEILKDVRQEVPIHMISAKFHNALAETIVAVARKAGHERVVLTGGCFQNRYLVERSVFRLSSEGFRPIWHRLIPPNDGGISLGQIVAAVNQVEG